MAEFEQLFEGLRDMAVSHTKRLDPAVKLKDYTVGFVQTEGIDFESTLPYVGRIIPSKLGVLTLAKFNHKYTAVMVSIQQDPISGDEITRFDFGGVLRNGHTEKEIPNILFDQENHRIGNAGTIYYDLLRGRLRFVAKNQGTERGSRAITRLSRTLDHNGYEDWMSALVEDAILSTTEHLWPR